VFALEKRDIFWYPGVCNSHVESALPHTGVSVARGALRVGTPGSAAAGAAAERQRELGRDATLERDYRY